MMHVRQGVSMEDTARILRHVQVSINLDQLCGEINQIQKGKLIHAILPPPVV